MLNVVQRRYNSATISSHRLTLFLQEELYALRVPDPRHGHSADMSPMRENFIGGFNVPHSRSPAPPAPPPKDHTYYQPGQSSITSSQLTHMSAVERSHKLRVARMNPHLQVCIYFIPPDTYFIT